MKLPQQQSVTPLFSEDINYYKNISELRTRANSDIATSEDTSLSLGSRRFSDFIGSPPQFFNDYYIPKEYGTADSMMRSSHPVNCYKKIPFFDKNNQKFDHLLKV
jgi:hypothetical protein